MSASPCPLAERGEVPHDCPWAGYARDLHTDLAAGRAPGEALAKRVPNLLKQIDADRAHPHLAHLWGQSLNVDANTGTDIVEPRLLKALLERAGVLGKGESVHAGVQHTYAYMLSLLQTPYGYKRARWVDGGIERGFGLPAGALGPRAKEGTLLGNITFFMGRIALADSPRRQEQLSTIGQHAALRAYNYNRLQRRRVVERFVHEGNKVEIRTDLVAFPHPQPDLTHLLIYSVDQGEQPQLITAFPVGKQTVDSVLRLPRGKGVEVQSRYNGFIAGLTDAKEPVRGERLEVR